MESFFGHFVFNEDDCSFVSLRRKRNDVLQLDINDVEQISANCNESKMDREEDGIIWRMAIVIDVI